MPDAEAPTTRTQGLTLRNFKASAAEVPLSPAFLSTVRRLAPLPKSLSFDELKGRLAAGGIDLDDILPDVLAAMTPEDRAAVDQALANPIPLQYVSTFEGSVAVDPKTGTEVDVLGVAETISAKPVLDLAPLQSLLAKYSGEPAVRAAAPVLTALASAPAAPLFAYHYAQTDASVQDIAAEAKSRGNQIDLAERWIPLGLLTAGAVALVLAGTSLFRRRRQEARIPAGAPATPYPA